MAVFCYIVGAIMLPAFALGGHVLATYILGISLFRNSFGFLPEDWMVYAFIMGVCCLIGLLFFLNWLFIGLNSAKIRKHTEQ